MTRTLSRPILEKVTIIAQIYLFVTIVAALYFNVLLTAHRFRLFHCIDHRKAHQGEIPAMGGIDVLLSFAVAGLVVVLVVHGDPRLVMFSYRYASNLAGAALMHVTGMVDEYGWTI